MAIRIRRALLGATLFVVLGVGAGLLVLARSDPSRHFDARRGSVLRVERDGATVEDGHRLEAVTVHSTSGVAVPMLIKRPLHDDASPLVLVLGGHTTGRDAARLIPDTQGRTIVALSYPYDGPHRMKGLEVLRWVPRIRQALFDTPPAIQLALDWLLTQPWVDPTEVHGLGASLGTPFMVVAAARDPRITQVWSVHGAGRSRTLLAHNARASVPGPLAPALGALADLLVAGPVLTPERWVGRISPRPFTMLNATEDERLPREAVTALYDAAGEPKALVWMPGPHVLRSRPEVVQALVTTVLERMDAGGTVP
jgi:dienelactone hydrolase